MSLFISVLPIHIHIQHQGIYYKNNWNELISTHFAIHPTYNLPIKLLVYNNPTIKLPLKKLTFGH